MALIDDIEFYGRAVDAGDMAREDAATALAEASNGGLTRLGAATALGNWQTARAGYENVFNQAFHGKAAIENGRHPHPSSKRRTGRDPDPAARCRP
jgi:hypothetical protein